MDKVTVIKSLIYKFTERFSVKCIGLVISIIQARLLAPEVFGQLSLLLVFTDLSLTVVDGGLNSALVQSKEVKERDYSTVFIITLGLTAVMIVLLYFAAPLIAGYYQSPALIMPLRIYSLSMFFSAFNSIQVARMQREMRFREMMYCSLAATLTAGTLGIAMAYKGAGLWALVGYYFSHIAVTCIAMFCTDRWIPRGKFSKDSAKRLYGFGIKMLASSMITTIYNDIRPLIIGKKFSTADLGYYERGQRFSTTVSRNLDTAVQSVMFPVMAQAQDDKKQVRANAQARADNGRVRDLPGDGRYVRRGGADGAPAADGKMDALRHICAGTVHRRNADADNFGKPRGRKGSGAQRYPDEAGAPAQDADDNCAARHRVCLSLGRGHCLRLPVQRVAGCDHHLHAGEAAAGLRLCRSGKGICGAARWRR